ncbi:MAG: hypothetical protein SPE27_04265 [Prevotella sp.]|nr:hypothetical protein [Prevotella sp.]
MRPHTTIFSGAFIALCLAASNGVAANNSPSKHLTTSPSQHLNTSPSQHLNTSPSQHLTTSPSQHLNTSPSQHPPSPQSALLLPSVSSCRTPWRRRFAR